jgi:hypothetical protein
MQGGKLYATVQERLVAAHGEDAKPAGIVAIKTSVADALSGGQTVVQAEVTFTDGRIFTGMSLARFDATRGADATNPIECAETSAVGRALAFAGYYGSDDGLAGAEEVRDARRFGPINRVGGGVSAPAPGRAPSVGTQAQGRIAQDAGAGPRPAQPGPYERGGAAGDDPGPLEAPDWPAGVTRGAAGATGFNSGAPITPKQIEALKRWKVPDDQMPTTRADASAMMSKLIEEKGQQRG